MASEIIITSTPRGLTGGSGFQPVKRTRGMTPAVSERLTGRSGYNHIYSAGDPRNPIVISHRVEHVGREYLNVLSVIRDAGTDHSGRSNRLAHLICVEASETEGAKAGPAAVIKKLVDAKTFCNAWKENAHESIAFQIPKTTEQAASFNAWNALKVDPGYAGVLADAAANSRNIVLLVPEKADVLSLFVEAMRLVPPAMRWKTTFTTFGSGQEDFTWQAVVAGSPAAGAIRQTPNLIDLTKNSSPEANPYVDFVHGKRACLPWKSASTYSNKRTREISTKVSPDGLTRQLPPLNRPIKSSSTARQQAAFTKKSRMPSPRTQTYSSQISKNSKVWSWAITCGVVVALVTVSFIQNPGSLFIETSPKAGITRIKTNESELQASTPLENNNIEQTSNISETHIGRRAAVDDVSHTAPFRTAPQTDEAESIGTAASKKEWIKQKSIFSKMKLVLDFQKKVFLKSPSTFSLGYIDISCLIEGDIHKTIDLGIAAAHSAKDIEIRDEPEGWKLSIENEKFQIYLEGNELKLKPIGRKTKTEEQIDRLRFCVLILRSKFAEPDSIELAHRIVIGKPYPQPSIRIGEEPVSISASLPRRFCSASALFTVSLQQPHCTQSFQLEESTTESSKTTLISNKSQITTKIRRCIGDKKPRFEVSVSQQGIDPVADILTAEQKQNVQKEQADQFKDLNTLPEDFTEWTDETEHLENFNAFTYQPWVKENFNKYFNKKGHINSTQSLDDWVNDINSFFEKKRHSKNTKTNRDFWNKRFIEVKEYWQNAYKDERLAKLRDEKEKPAFSIKSDISCRIITQTASGEQIPVCVIEPLEKEATPPRTTTKAVAEKEFTNAIRS